MEGDFPFSSTEMDPHFSSTKTDSATPSCPRSPKLCYPVFMVIKGNSKSIEATRKAS